MWSRVPRAIGVVIVFGCATQIEEEPPGGHDFIDAGTGGSVDAASGGSTASGGFVSSGGTTSGGSFGSGGSSSGGTDNASGGNGVTGGTGGSSGSGGGPAGSGGTSGTGGSQSTGGTSGSGGTGGSSGTCDEASAMAITTPADVAGNACVKFSVTSASTGLMSRTGAFPVPFTWWNCTQTGTGTFSDEWDDSVMLSPTSSSCPVVIQFEGSSAQFGFQWWAN